MHVGEKITAQMHHELRRTADYIYSDYKRFYLSKAPHRAAANVDRNRAVTFDRLSPDNAKKSLKEFAREWGLSPNQVKGIVRRYKLVCLRELADPVSYWTRGRPQPFWRGYVHDHKALVKLRTGQK
jgi:hypothetical protein